MNGLRKFWAFVLALSSFTALMIINKDMDPFNLGLAITLLVSSFIAGNSIVHIKGKGEKQSNNETIVQ